MEVNLISKKQGCKKDAFVIFYFSDFKIVLVLSVNIKTLYIQVFKVVFKMAKSKVRAKANITSLFIQFKIKILKKT